MRNPDPDPDQDSDSDEQICRIKKNLVCIFDITVIFWF